MSGGPRPETGKQVEIGLKQDLLDRALNLNVALYELTRQNVRTRDPDNAGFSLQTGEQRSRGVEIDLVGRITPDWNITAAYTYTDAEVTRDNTLPVGDGLPGVPRHAASLFTAYEVPAGALRGLSVGGGVFYRDAFEASLPNDLRLPATTRVDLLLAYAFDRYRVQLNLQNVTDERLYVADGYTLIPQAGRTAFLTFTARFGERP